MTTWAAFDGHIWKFQDVYNLSFHSHRRNGERDGYRSRRDHSQLNFQKSSFATIMNNSYPSPSLTTEHHWGSLECESGEIIASAVGRSIVTIADFSSKGKKHSILGTLQRRSRIRGVKTWHFRWVEPWEVASFVAVVWLATFALLKAEVALRAWSGKHMEYLE